MKGLWTSPSVLLPIALFLAAPAARCPLRRRRWGILDHPTCALLTSRSSRGVGRRDRGRGTRRTRTRQHLSGSTRRARSRSCSAGIALRPSAGRRSCRPVRLHTPRGSARCRGLVVLRVGGFERVPVPPWLEHHWARWARRDVLWIVAVVNFYNFLDGIDGLAALQAIVTGGSPPRGWDPFAATAGGALVRGRGGIPALNWARASVFLGTSAATSWDTTLAGAPAPGPAAPAVAGAVLGAVTLAALAGRDVTAVGRALRERSASTSATGSLTRSWLSAWATQGHAGDRPGSTALTAAAASSGWRSQKTPGAWVAFGLGLVLLCHRMRMARSAGPRAATAWRWPAPQCVAAGRRLVLTLGLTRCFIWASFYAAHVLRVEGQIPPREQLIFRRFLPLFLVTGSPCTSPSGCNRWSFGSRRLSTRPCAVRDGRTARHRRLRAASLLPPDPDRPALARDEFS